MPDSATNIGNTLGTAWHVAHAKFITQIGWISGSGSPIGSVTPTFTGQEYFDTSGHNWWRSYGTSNTQWVEIGGTSDSLGATTISAASANALAVGANGATNPVLNVDSSATSVATGIDIVGAAAGGGVAIKAISSGTPESLTIDAIAAGTITLNGTATGQVHAGHGLTIDANGLTVTAGGITVTAGSTTLPAGTATVAPLILTSGTNLTAAAAGAVEFDGAAFYATAVASARQQLDAEQFVIATANSATYNNTGLDTNAAAAVFTSTMNAGVTNGAVSLVAGKVYAFEANYMLTNTGTTSHTWAALFGGTATFSAGTSFEAFGLSGTTANATATGGQTGFFAGTDLTNGGTGVVISAASTSATEQLSVQLSGILICANAGTLIPQLKASARPGASGTPGVVVKAGTFFRIWEMATGAVVGNWS